MSKTSDKKADPAAADAAAALTETPDDAANMAADAAKEPQGGETDAATDNAAAPEQQPEVNYVPQMDRVRLRLKMRTALGNGTRDKGFVLGELVTAIGRSLDEAIAAVQHPLADVRIDFRADGTMSFTSQQAAQIAGRNFPAGTHFCSVRPAAGVQPREILNAINGFGRIV